MAEFFGGQIYSDRKKAQDRVRKSLRLVKGGKEASPIGLQMDGLENDPFLRTHYLVRQKTEQKMFSWMDGRQYIMSSFLNDELPSDAG